MFYCTDLTNSVKDYLLGRVGKKKKKNSYSLPLALDKKHHKQKIVEIIYIIYENLNHEMRRILLFLSKKSI
jgi:hypothetical protein